MYDTGRYHNSDSNEWLTFPVDGEASGQVDEIITRYFKDELLRRQLPPDPMFVKVDVQALALPLDSGQTDDYLHSLQVGDTVIAAVLDRRNEYNNRQIIFLRLDPAPVVQYGGGLRLKQS